MIVTEVFVVDVGVPVGVDDCVSIYSYPAEPLTAGQVNVAVLENTLLGVTAVTGLLQELKVKIVLGRLVVVLPEEAPHWLVASELLYTVDVKLVLV